MTWDLADRKSPTRPLQVTCTLEVPRWGDPRRPVPTAASVAAVELGPCQGEVIRAPAGNALRGTNGSFIALLELMLCKNPSVPQRYSNCAEARSPRTVWRWVARSLRLSPHERAGLRGTAGLATLPARVSSTMPEPLHRLKALGFSRLHSALRALQTDSAWRSARAYIGLVRRGLAFDPSPLTSDL